MRNTPTAQVNARIDRCASGLLQGREDLDEERVAFFLPASLDYVAMMHGTWRAGGIAVPLNVASAAADLEHYLSCASVTRLVASIEHHDALRPLCESLDVALLTAEDVLADTPGPLPTVDPQRRAMMVFTSGTTNKPKGVVSTHKAIRSQITTLIDAWAWTDEDTIPLFLPLHHLHGIINILSLRTVGGRRRPSVRQTRHPEDNGPGAGGHLQRVHGCADRLCQADPALRVHRPRPGRQYLRGLWQDAAECLGFGRLSGQAVRAVAGTDRPGVAGTLRHDRDRHGPVQPLCRRASRRLCGATATGCCRATVR